jgi:hypothetical protein
LIARRNKGADVWLASALDQAIVLTRLPEGMEFLLGLIVSDPRQASSALEAISRVHNSSEVRVRVAAAVARSESERVMAAYRQHFPEAAHEPSGEA